MEVAVLSAYCELRASVRLSSGRQRNHALPRPRSFGSLRSRHRNIRTECDRRVQYYFEQSATPKPWLRSMPSRWDVKRECSLQLSDLRITFLAVRFSRMTLQ